jgi:hypothetical protein
MKKALLIIFLIVACKRNDVIPQHDTLTGSTWVSYMFGYPGGKDVYKVLEFKPNSQVKIDYKINKTEDYIKIGQFTYMSQGTTFWVLNANNTRTDGEAKGEQIVFDGKLFDKL